jgi:hypothetical protein
VFRAARTLDLETPLVAAHGCNPLLAEPRA